MITMKYMQHVNIMHPDTDEVVELQIFKMDNGALVGIDKRQANEICDTLYSPYECSMPMEENE